MGLELNRFRRHLRRRLAAAAAGIFAGGLAGLAGGCAAPVDAPPAAPPALTAREGAPACGTALPDLNRLGASVQAQIQERRAAVTGAGDGAEAASDAPAARGALGMMLMAASLPEAAETCFREAATLAPDDPRWLYYLGHLHREAGDLSAAARLFEAVLRLRPDDVAALVWLGEVRLAQDRPVSARPLFEQALALRPASLSARYGLGRAALQAEDYQRAVDLLGEILARDPSAAAAHYPLGMAYRALGDEPRAAAHLRRRRGAALRPADPLMAEVDTLLESARAYEARGNEALDREEWSAAADLFRRGLVLDPEHPALRHRLGTALYVMGDAEGAMAEFERVMRESPDFPAVHYSVGVLLQGAGRHREAIERFETALRYQPTDGEVRLRLAVSLRRAGDPAAALDEYRTVLRMDPDVADARFGAAMALVQLRRYRGARDRLDAGIEAFPGAAIFPHALARLLAAAPDAEVRDGARAMRLVEQIASRGERTIDLGETMAMALAEVGRYDEAAAVQRDLVAAAEAEGMRAAIPRLTANLRLYEQGRPCRTPWPDDAIP
ncbi:MAG: tetratricopeptide repeat protein [Acidobacteria bacterium]|nr:tetratricopeptide repeat protein [Acidobacteriota bacterium]